MFDKFIGKFLQKRIDQAIEARFTLEDDVRGAVYVLGDPDGATIARNFNKKIVTNSHFTLQGLTYDMYREFPYIRSDIDRKVNMVTGKDFGFSSYISEIDEFLEEEVYDHRNILWWRIPGWILRSLVEGELFFLVTVQPDGFCVFNVIEPCYVTGALDGTGIWSDPNNVLMPLYYNIKDTTSGGDGEIIPSINHIYDSSYDKIPLGDMFKRELLAGSRMENRGKYKALNGYYRFVIHWNNMNGVDEAKRDTSYLRAVIKYVNFYQQAILWSMDYRKSLASWSQEVKFSDDAYGQKAYRLWMKMTAEEKAATGLTKPPSPGDRVFSMPGMTVTTISNNQGKAGSGESLDLRNMLVSGMDAPSDVITSDLSQGNRSSNQQTRSPYADTAESLQVKFERLFKYGLWAHIFKIKSLMDESFREDIKVDVPVDFEEKKEKAKIDGMPEETVMKVKTQKRKRKAFHFIDVTFPVLNIQDMEGLSSGLLGSKHGSVIESLGVPPSRVAERMGFKGYRKLRLQNALEEEQYPKRIPLDQQEKVMEGKPVSNSKSPAGGGNNG